MSKKVLILAGGGGHTSIAVAIAQTLFRKVYLTFLVPREDWLSRKLLNPYGSVYSILKPRGPLTPNLEFFYRFIIALIQSLKIINSNYDLIVSSGSNFCVPPALVGWLKKIPVINIESRVALLAPSKTAKFLQHFSILTILQWEEQNRNLYGYVSGPIFQEPEYVPWDGGYILVTGGTQGFKRLFDALSESELKNIVLQTGKVDPAEYKKKHPEWEVFSYTDIFQEYVAGASLLITHQGGGTIFEAIIYNKPLIIVNNPELTRTAGVEEIRLLSEKINALFLKDITLERIQNKIEKIRDHPYITLTNGSKNVGRIITSLLNVDD